MVERKSQFQRCEVIQTILNDDWLQPNDLDEW